MIRTIEKRERTGMIYKNSFFLYIYNIFSSPYVVSNAHVIFYLTYVNFIELIAAAHGP